MTTPDSIQEFALLRDDLLYHQARVLILIDAICRAPVHNKRLEGLTKLAKLDFLVRYPALAPDVLERLDPSDTRLHLQDEDSSRPADVEAPMIRYKYGPWDDRYYPIIGALVGRGLIRYAQPGRGSLALAPTPAGRRLTRELTAANEWADIGDRCIAIAEASSGLSGNALKNLIYQHLASLMDRPLRQVIK
jgi:hypothetical protein